MKAFPPGNSTIRSLRLEVFSWGAAGLAEAGKVLSQANGRIGSGSCCEQARLGEAAACLVEQVLSMDCVTALLSKVETDC